MPPGGGFGSTELLAVIAVMVLLAALALSAVRRVDPKARRQTCLHHLRQLELGWSIYSGDNNDKLVRSAGMDQLVGDVDDPAGRTGGAKSQWVLGSVDSPSGATNRLLVQQGLLFPYVNNLTSYKCPGDGKMVDGKATVRSISMNCWLNPIRDWNSIQDYGGRERLRVFRKQADITAPSPANCWVMIDESPVGINDGWFVCDPNETYSWRDVPAGYHGDAGGLSFADGHAEIKSWRDPAVLRRAAPGTPRDGTSGDLPWLQERSTSRP